MTALAAPVSPTRTAGSRPWRWAGGLALAHVVVMIGAFVSEGVAVDHGAAFASVKSAYAEASLNQTLSAGYVEALAFLVLVPAIVLIARLFSGLTLATQTAAHTFLALGIAYAASTLAVGFPPGAAAAYAAHHGVDAATIATVNDIRNFGFYLQVATSAAMALALGVAAVAGRIHARWVGWVGIAVGGIGLAVVPFAQNAVSMVWLVWWVGLAVLLLRGGPTAHGGERTNA